MTDESTRSPDPDPDPAPERPDRFDEPTPSVPWRLGGFLLIATLLIVFAVQNTQDVSLNFLGWEWNLPLVIVILIFSLVAVLLDEVLGGLLKRRRRRALQEKAELERLRSQD